jgi:hypothetical protein
MIQTLELVIKEYPFFHGLSDERLTPSPDALRNVQFPGKHLKFTEGDPADEFYFISADFHASLHLLLLLSP